MAEQQAREYSDSARAVIGKTLERLKGQLPETILRSLQDLVPTGCFFDTDALTAAIRASDTENDTNNAD